MHQAHIKETTEIETCTGISVSDVFSKNSIFTSIVVEEKFVN